MCTNVNTYPTAQTHTYQDFRTFTTFLCMYLYRLAKLSFFLPLPLPLHPLSPPPASSPPPPLDPLTPDIHDIVIDLVYVIIIQVYHNLISEFMNFISCRGWRGLKPNEIILRIFESKCGRHMKETLNFSLCTFISYPFLK